MFRFTIRELVLLTLVVAMGGAWWVHAMRLQRDADELTIRTEMLSGAMEHLGITPSFNAQALILTITKDGTSWDEMIIQKANYIGTDGRALSRKYTLVEKASPDEN